MIQIETANNYKNSDLLSLKNSFDIGLNKPLSYYTPHINALKAMNKEPMNKAANKPTHTGHDDDLYFEDPTTSAAPEFYENGHHLDEDIYDFSNVNVRPSLNLDTSSNNPTDDEEEDINFDYGYGYDYENVIKDRLKIANQEFKNDSEPPKRKSILVSFDNAVTAFDIVNEGDTESEVDNSKSPIPHDKQLKFNDHSTNNDNIVKLPLNDTVHKDDPDSFANKIRDAVLRYDAEQSNLINSNSNDGENTYQYNHLKHSHHPDENNNHDSHNNNNNKFISNTNNIATSSPIPSHNQSNTNNESQQPKSKTLNSPTFNITNTNAPPPKSGSSPDFTRQNTTNLTPAKKVYIQAETKANADNNDAKATNNNSKVVHIISDADKDDKKLNVTTAKQTAKVEEDKTKTKKSPSPILSPKSPSPELTLPKKNSQEPPKKSSFSSNGSNNNLDNRVMSPIKVANGSPKSKLSIDFSSDNDKKSPNETDATKTEEIKSPKSLDTLESLNKLSTNSKEDKVLIERDGKFELVTAEEYTAYEKKLALERSNKNKANAKKNVNKAPLIPHPPVRPKTSHETLNRNSSLKTRYLMNKNDNSINNGKSQTTEQIQIKRVTHSADFTRSKDRSKSHSPIGTHRTPEYAQNYKSPYQMTVKIYKSATETAEEKKKREKEEEEKRRLNEDAFKKWLKNKEEQRLMDEKKKQKQENDKKNNTQETIDDSKDSFQAWLRRKQEQMEKEREYQKKLEQVVLLDKQRITPEERTKAYKEWIQRKIKEKNEALKIEKIEHKKWLARRRRSRKHQRLSQALEMAQAYGYNSGFYTSNAF